MSQSGRIAAAVLLAAAALGGAPGGGGPAGLAAARAAGDWKKEFEEICAKTQDAMALETPELEALVARCDALKPAVEALDEPLRKVYTRRLKTCRDLYQFVIDFRREGKG